MSNYDDYEEAITDDEIFDEVDDEDYPSRNGYDHDDYENPDSEYEE